jgi:MMPL family
VRRLTNWSARHPWRTLAAWGVAVLVGIALTAAFIGDLTTESEVTNNPESEQAYQLMGSRVPFNPDEQVNELIVVRTDDPTVDDARFEQKVTQLADAIRSDTVVVHDFYETHDPALICKDLKAVLITVGLVGDAEADIEDVVDTVQRADEPPLRRLDHRRVERRPRPEPALAGRSPRGGAQVRAPRGVHRPAARLRNDRGRPRNGSDGDHLDRGRARPHRAPRPGVRALDLHRNMLTGMGLALGID